MWLFFNNLRTQFETPQVGRTSFLFLDFLTLLWGLRMAFSIISHIYTSAWNSFHSREDLRIHKDFADVASSRLDFTLSIKAS